MIVIASEAKQSSGAWIATSPSAPRNDEQVMEIIAVSANIETIRG